MSHRPAAAALLACAAALVAAPAAHAGVLAYEGAALVYRAAPGNSDSVTIGGAEDGSGRVAVGLADDLAGWPSDRCERVTESHPVVCPVTGPIRVELLDGDDRAAVQDLVTPYPVTLLGGDGADRLEGGWKVQPATLDGGTGDDVLTSRDAADELVGGPGADELTGGAGDDRLSGGEGDDTLQPDRDTTGDDLVDGGPGIDRVEDWSDPTGPPVPVSLTLDGKANDGRPGERDDVRDVEVVRTYAGGSFVMGDGPDRVEVYAPSDRGPARVEGRGGDDVLLAGVGAQELDGGPGADRIEGGFGNDVLTGGPGRDVIDADFTGTQCGWLQSCTIPHGDDLVLARDGEADTVDCGVGQDRAVVDAIDTVSGCEQVDVDRGAGRVVAPGVVAGRPRITVVSRRLAPALGRGLVVRVSGVRPGVVTVRARSGRRVVATGTGRAGAAGAAVVRLRFTAPARRVLAGRSSVRLVVQAGGARLAVVLRRSPAAR